MNEIIFLIEYALEEDLQREDRWEYLYGADTLDQIKVNIKESVECHFDNGKNPKTHKTSYD